MKSKWNELTDEQCYHNLHVIKGMAKRYDDFCNEFVDVFINRLTAEEKEKVLRYYIFSESRDGNPKDTFIFAESNDLNYLIEKYNFTPEEFS
jgi:hypothetical protein